MNLLKYFLSGLIVVTSLNLFAQAERKYIRKGTKEYSEKKYGNSEVTYQKAVDTKPGSFEANFNLGDALYKQEKYDDAIKKFSTLRDQTKEKQNLALINHNIGNCFLNKTAKLLKDNKLDSAINNVNQSIDAYKNSLRNNPEDRQTKHNLGYANLLKKMLEDQKKNQQNNKNKDNKDQNQDKQDQDKKDNQDKDKKDQKDQDKNKQDQNKNDQNKQDNKDKDDDDKSDSKDSKDNNQNLKSGKGQISKEDAERLLNAIENDEKNVQEKVKKVKGVRTNKQEKDW
jgi:hypothetical protein